MSKPYIVIITGFPATGKTRMADELATRLGVLRVSKDAIKDKLFDTLGYSDKSWSHHASAAAHRIMDYITEGELAVGHAVILESNFKAGIDDDRFAAIAKKFGVPIVQILCWAEEPAIFERYMSRKKTGEQHAGHVEEVSMAEIRKAHAGGKIPVLNVANITLEIETTDFTTVNYDAIAAHVTTAIQSL